MSIYARQVLPRLLDLAMRHRLASEHRAKLVPRASGTVVEIGIGSGLNLAHYTEAVTRVHGVDPSAELLAMARERARGRPFELSLDEKPAEALPLDDASADTAVCTWTLCSVGDPLAALGELRRVLKPGARLFFIEHGAAPERGVAAWQRRLTPLWKKIAGGCHLDRDIEGLLGAAGFRIVELEKSYLQRPHAFTYTYEGVALA